MECHLFNGTIFQKNLVETNLKNTMGIKHEKLIAQKQLFSRKSPG